MARRTRPTEPPAEAERAKTSGRHARSAENGADDVMTQHSEDIEASREGEHADDDDREGEGEGQHAESAEQGEDDSRGHGDDDGRGDDPESELEAGPSDDVIEGEVVDVDENIPLTRPDAAQISSTDPLQAYMRDVQRYSLLTPEETNALAVKYVQTGDVDAARKLVTSNLRLVVKIAYDYRRAYRNILDLIQEGNIGLMQAVKKYDPYRGVKLSSYAAWWIRAYILRFILNNWRLVKLGTTQAQRKLFFNLKKEKARLSAMGIDPTPETIAARLDVATEEVIHMERRLSAGEASLDAPVGQSDGRATSRIELMPGESGPIDDALASAEIQELLSGKIREYGATLKGKEDVIFRERLMSDEPKTLQELGQQFGVSRERVRQIEKRLQGKIRLYLEQNVERSALPS